MISAGQTNNVNQTPTIGVSNSPLTWNSGPAQSSNFNLTLDKDASKNYMEKLNENQKFNNKMAAGTQAWNAAMQALTTGLNFSLQKQFLTLQEKISDHSFVLGMSGVDLEMKKVDASERIAKENASMNIRMTRIQSQTQIAIANIERKGKTERAKLFTGLNAFQRNNYNTGKPTFQTSILS